MSLQKAQQYILDVQSGTLPACLYVKQAVARHLADLATGQARGLYFNAEAAESFFKFVSLLRFTKGDRVGQRVELEPWQSFHFMLLFGWRIGSPTGPRRFRISYLEIPRKNGKTTMAAAVAIYTAFFDNEARAQVYTAATKRDQAKLCLKDCQAFVNASPALSRYLGTFQNSVVVHQRSGRAIDDNFIHALSADANTMDGLDVHCAIVDELHAHPTAELVDVIKTATGARVQPLIYEITTAGVNKESVCYEHRSYGIRLLANEIEDDRFLALIYTLDHEDIFTDPSTWIKANPNLGVSKKIDYIEGELNEAQNRPSYESTVKRYDFNLWTDAYTTWIQDAYFTTTATAEPADLAKNYVCFAGLDLAATEDFNALALFFENKTGGPHYFKHYYWIPEAKLHSRTRKLPHQAKQWVKHSSLKIMPGNVMDDNLIKEDLLQLIKRYDVKSLAYDRHLAHSGIVQEIATHHGADFVTSQAQNIGAMSEPTKSLEKLLLSKSCRHEGNPITRWMLGNVLIYRDANDNCKIIKNKSADKVDGIVALVMAVAEYMVKGQYYYAPGSARKKLSYVKQ